MGAKREGQADGVRDRDKSLVAEKTQVQQTLKRKLADIGKGKGGT